MIFSYGFLESDRKEARQVLLDMNMPSDDPLGVAKNMICRETPGIRLSSVSDTESSSHIVWDSPIIWLASVNEEDGLHIGVTQTNDGAMELETIWREEKLASPNQLREYLAADPSWDIFQLRAVVLLLERLEAQLSLMKETDDVLGSLQENQAIFEAIFRPEIFSLASRLRNLETKHLENAISDLTNQASDSVLAFFFFSITYPLFARLVVDLLGIATNYPL